MTQKRFANKTSFITGEGKADRLFLAHLKSIYTKRNSDHRITVHKSTADNVSGGSSQEVLHNALLHCCRNGIYNAVVVLLDKDILELSCDQLYKQSKLKIRKQFRHQVPNSYSCIVVNPCLEGLILEIVTSIKAPKTSTECKQRFKEYFRKDAHEITKQDYSRALTEEILNEAAARIEPLNKLITFFSLPGHPDDKFNAWFS